MKNKINIVPGRLYSWRGNVVRAGRPTSNNLRHCKIHGIFHGFVSDSALELIPKSAVKQYLALANV